MPANWNNQKQSIMQTIGDFLQSNSRAFEFSIYKNFYILSCILIGVTYHVSYASKRDTNQSSKGGKHHEWTYGNGPTGPKKWAELKSAYAACAAGVDQSPINLIKPADGEGDKLIFDYLPSAFSFFNNGHTVQFTYDPGSIFDNGKEQFELLQFHFHTPSEHKVDGKSYPLELHLVHKNRNTSSKTTLAVVGVFITQGAENRLLQPLFEKLPSEGETDKIPGLFLNASALIPESRKYFYYPGSLTTPPCSEGVAWHVMKSPIEASSKQIASFKNLFHNNARPVQPINDRILREN